MSYRNYTGAGKNEQMALSNSMDLLFAPGETLQHRTTQNAQRNYTHCNAPQYDAIVNQFDATINIDEAKRLFNQVDMYTIEQHWAVNVCPVAVPVAWQPWVKRYSGELFVESGYYRALWWIGQDLKKSVRP